MMKELILSLVACILSIGTLTAQRSDTTRKNAIELRAGLETGHYKDLNLSPLNYNSTGIALNLGYTRTLKQRGQILFTLNPQVGAITTDFSEYQKAGHYTADISLGYLQPLKLNISNVEIKVGGQYQIYLDLTFYDGVEAVSFFGLHSFDLIGNVSWQLSENHQLTGSLSLPAFGLLVRPPYTGWDKYIVEQARNPLPVFFRGDWRSLNKYTAITSNIEYQFTVGPKLDLLAGYQFRFYKTNVIKTAIYPSNQITVGTKFKF